MSHLRLVTAPLPGYWIHVAWKHAQDNSVYNEVTSDEATLSGGNFISHFDITSTGDLTRLKSFLKDSFWKLDRRFHESNEHEYTLLIGHGNSRDPADATWLDTITSRLVRKGPHNTTEEVDRRVIRDVAKTINQLIAKHRPTALPLDLHIPPPYTGRTIELFYTLSGESSSSKMDLSEVVLPADFDCNHIPQRGYFNLEDPSHVEDFIRIWTDLAEQMKHHPSGKGEPGIYVGYYEANVFAHNSFSPKNCLFLSPSIKEENAEEIYRDALNWAKNAEEGQGGKLYLLDPSGKANNANNASADTLAKIIPLRRPSSLKLNNQESPPVAEINNALLHQPLHNGETPSGFSDTSQPKKEDQINAFCKRLEKFWGKNFKFPESTMEITLQPKKKSLLERILSVFRPLQATFSTQINKDGLSVCYLTIRSGKDKSLAHIQFYPSPTGTMKIEVTPARVDEDILAAALAWAGKKLEMYMLPNSPAQGLSPQPIP